MGFAHSNEDMPPKLPKPVTQVHVDYIDYRNYLEKKYPKEWKRHQDELWEWFCDTNSFRNGCFVYMETKEVLGYEDKDAINWFADRIFEDYGEVADKFGIIRLWVWW